jgi:hypothetical protein
MVAARRELNTQFGRNHPTAAISRIARDTDFHLSISLPPGLGAPHPRFPVELGGFRALHAPFLKERRTRGALHCSVQEIRGISLVFREMWDTTNLNVLTYRDTGGQRSEGILQFHSSSQLKFP